MPVSTSCRICSSFSSVLFGLVLSLACCVLPSSTVAQTELASVYGRVTDQSGAVIVDAEVEIKNVETGISTTVKTNQDGLYTIPSLHPGHYLVNVRRAGFKSVTVTELTLNVQDNVVRNFSLQIGSVAETVTITADSLNINTTDATVSTVVDRQFAENLPLNGRSFQSLIQLTPGVVLTVNNGFDSGQFSVNGQRASSNYWMVDGVSANVGISPGVTTGNGLGGTLGSFSVFGGTNSLVSVDALQEFRIQTSTYAPEFGRTPGGQISIVTRAGTNQFHGTAFDYFRNDALDANDWFASSKKLRKPPEHQNDFGGTLSGPIFKSRTFFFFSYEGLRLRLPQVGQTFVPDVTARQNASSTMQPFLNAYPLPNGSDNAATGVAQFNSSFSIPGTLDAYSLRVDHKLNDKLNVFGRYNYSPSEIDQRGISGLALSTVVPLRIVTQTGTVGWTWSMSSAAANDFRFNYSSSDASSHGSLDNFGGATPFSGLPFQSPFTPQNARLGFTIFSLGTSGRTYLVGDNAHNEQKQFNIVEGLSLQKGAHSMKFGVDFRRLSPQFGIAEYSQVPIFLSVAKAETGSPFRTSLTSSLNATFLFRNLGVFAQDTWRVAPRLTLTYGLRWDIDFVPSTINGPSFEAVTGFNLRDLSQLALAPTGTPPYSTTYGNVAPRIGIAYQVSQTQNWQTVVRGGFGVFYDLATSEAGNNLSASFTEFPFGAFGTVSGGSFPFAAGAAPPPAIVAPNASNGQSLFAFNPNLELPYTLEWNVAVEQALGMQQTITASYIGSVGRRLIQTASAVSPNPNFAGANLVTNAATSDYGALQLQYQRRLSHGLQALASYTWSHSIDTASAGSFGSAANAFSAFDPNANRGASDFDIRHTLSMALTYAVPTPKTNALGRAILGGWSTENIVQARSAPPINVYYDPSGFGSVLDTNFFTQVRPNVVSGIPLYIFGPQYPGGKAFNNTPGAVQGGCQDGSASIGPFCPAAKDPSTGLPQQGNLGRNALRGFGAFQWDFAVHRDFRLRESVKLQFRAEMFNVLNHPNFGQPNGDLGSPSVPNRSFGVSSAMLGQSLGGTIGAGGFDPLYQIGGPRSIQFALKFQF